MIRFLLTASAVKNLKKNVIYFLTEFHFTTVPVVTRLCEIFPTRCTISQALSLPLVSNIIMFRETISDVLYHNCLRLFTTHANWRVCSISLVWCKCWRAFFAACGLSMCTIAVPGLFTSIFTLIQASLKTTLYSVRLPLVCSHMNKAD